jgi:hypothetical protein
MLLSALLNYQGVGMQAVRKNGVRAVVAAGGIGALLLIGTPSAQAWDGEYQGSHFYGTSQVSFQDARDIAYASAVESGFPECYVYGRRSYGTPVTYEINLLCWTQVP